MMHLYNCVTLSRVNIAIVLILVVMDDALVHIMANWATTNYCIVLILVVMDDALVRFILAIIGLWVALS